MSKLILEHPNKTEIDTILRGTGSYRDKELKLQKELAIKISYKTLCDYHKNFLGSKLDLDTDLENTNTPVPLSLDFTEIETLTKKMKNELCDIAGDLDFFDTVKKETIELFTLQSAITKDALLKYARGECKYPSEHIKNLQIFTNLLYAKK